MLPKIIYPITFLKTKNLEENKKFYSGLLELEVALEQTNCIIYNIGSNGYWGFCETSEEISNPEKTCLTLVVETPDEVNLWAKYLKEKGVNLTKEPSMYEKYQIYNIFFNDPDRYTLEIQSFEAGHEPKNANKFKIDNSS
ncbi:MAG: VOC family protein [Candidatus Heimdallarchaeum aukensis]|uniref:VOC family protein n=1 Tax=Candidatus Heimdallarchaeum aukensis TaxID=2876573 RepID=A0A9Y1FLR6_9ARCH|nr:MAG: VOC family protein [Candidatus Heimdallarchaeum aukensis]